MVSGGIGEPWSPFVEVPLAVELDDVEVSPGPLGPSPSTAES